MHRPERKPPWLKRPFPRAAGGKALADSLERLGLFTVCQEAHCPNQGECFNRGTATFLLLGPRCSRACAFCAVRKGSPAPPDPDEPGRVARAARELGLDYCVLTMVTRDDLADGGAGQVARTVRALHRLGSGLGVEVLISDLGGSRRALETVLAAGPQVLNHNLETVPRLYPRVRPQAGYRRSLELLARAADAGMVTKSGLMLGLGEETGEVLAVMDDLVRAGCRLLTLGQYLAPSPGHHPVARYLEPREFGQLAAQARKRGFAAVASGPYVRSSYRAGQLYERARKYNEISR